MKGIISFFQVMLLSSLVGIIVVGLFLLSDINKISKVKKAELFYRMSHDFFILDTTNRGLIKALGDEKPIFKETGGNYNEYDVDDYLSHFELLKNYLDEGLAPEKDIYDTYSFYIIQAYQNKEIWQYVTDLRKDYKDSTYYKNFEFLAKRFIEENKNHKFSSH